MSKKTKKEIIFSCMIIVFIVMFCFGFVKSAMYAKEQLIARYYEGVECYENGNYRAAMEIFADLKGWGRRIVDIPPEDYYQMAIDNLENKDPATFKCPECGTEIELPSKSTE